MSGLKFLPGLELSAASNRLSHAMSLDRLAPFYRSLEAIFAGVKLQRCRLAFLGEIPVPQRILLAGEEPGRSFPECARRFPDAEIKVVDSSGRMLEIARAKTDSERVSFEHADLIHWQPPPEPFDLVVTHFSSIA